MKKKTPARVFRLPALSPVALRTFQALQHPQADAARVVRVMESDSDWAADLLRTAASPVWSRGAAPADLRGAVDVLGLRRVHQLVAAAAVGPLLREPVRGYGLAAGDLWDHSLATAIATREILLEKGLKPCEEAFTAALLHDVGKLVLGSALEETPEAVSELSEREGLSFEEAEERVLGHGHAEAGAVLLDRWKLPSWVVETVRAHHAPLESSSLIADLIHLADALCLSAGVGAGRDGLQYRVSTDVSQRWNLSRRSVERILGRTLGALAEAKDLVVVGQGR